MVMVGIEIGSLEDSNWSLLFCVVELKLEEAAAEWGDEGGRVEESKSWGRRESAGEVSEVVDDNNDGLRLDNVGDGGGEGFGREVMILVAGRMSLLNWAFFWDIARRRVAPTGISM